MSLLAGTVGSSTHPVMSRTFRVMQLNVRKQGEVHKSLMNDEETQGQQYWPSRNQRHGESRVDF
jgi:hypothetical protein